MWLVQLRAFVRLSLPQGLSSRLLMQECNYSEGVDCDMQVISETIILGFHQRFFQRFDRQMVFRRRLCFQHTPNRIVHWITL